jgi:hypothetical protein
MQRPGRPSLKGCLDILTRNDGPPLKEGLRVDYIILRRIANRKDWVDVEFVDGDGKDEKEWFEGPVHQQTTTIQALFKRRDKDDRRVRREVYGRTKLQDKVNDEVLTGKECELEASPNPSIDDERVAMDAAELALIKEYGSEDTDVCVSGQATCAGPRSSADTRQRASYAENAKRAETRPNARKKELRADAGKGISCAVDAERAGTRSKVHKSEVEEMDSPNRKIRRIETRSATKKGE